MTFLIRQYGLQRTGTNAIRYLIEANYLASIETLSGGSKHDAPAQKQDIYAGYLISVRDPLSWLSSYYRLRKKKANDRGDWLPKIEDLAEEYLDLWLMRTREHLFLHDKDGPTAVVQNESVVRSPLQETIRAAERLGIPRRLGSAFEIPTRRLRRGGAGDPVRSLMSGSFLDRHHLLSGGPARMLPRGVQAMAWRAFEALVSDRPDYLDHFDLSHLEKIT